MDSSVLSTQPRDHLWHAELNFSKAREKTKKKTASENAILIKTRCCSKNSMKIKHIM